MTSRSVHPWVFMILIIPFGVVSGYAGVTLAFQLKAAGVSVGQVAGLVSLCILPHTWKFLWAPVIDTTLDPRKWCFLAGIPTALGVVVMGALPTTNAGLSLLSLVVFLAGLATTFLGMSVESLLAHSVSEESKGQASGWFQAGNLGGFGVGGGLGLFLAQRLPGAWMASSIVGALCLLCSSFVLVSGLTAPARVAEGNGLARRVGHTLREVWEVLRSSNGWLALLLCVLPLGSSAASGLWSAVADEWHASADTVALVSGVLGGVVSAIGCIAGGYLCDRMPRQAAYVWFGFAQAAIAVAMALLPRTPFMFIVWSLLYAFSSGLCYAAFSAFVLEAIGKGAAATKYNALASISNLPIYYMTNLDGRAHDHWNSTGMLFTEALLAVVAAGVFLAVAKVVAVRRNGKAAPLPEIATPTAVSERA